MDDPLHAAPGADEGRAVLQLVRRVLAWQHRQPLAARLVAGQVGGWGVVALPFATPAQPGKPPQPLFNQPALLPGLSQRALEAFARRHGVSTRPAPPDWPQREVLRADGAAEPAPETLYLLTAAIQDRPWRPGAAVPAPRRVLLAPQSAAVWGRRPSSPPRLAVAGVLALVLGLLCALGLGRLLAPGGGSAPDAARPGVAASAASASAPGSVPASGSASVPASAPAPTPAPAPAAAPASAAAALPSAVAASAPPVAAAAKPASAPVMILPAASAAPAAGAAPPAPQVATAPPRAPLPPVALTDGPHYALVSVPVRQRQAAEFTQSRIQQSLGHAMGGLQAQIMPTPQGYVVTVWPLPSQADAEQLAAVLARRGVPMKWMEF